MSFSASRPVIDLVTALLAQGCKMWPFGKRDGIETPTEQPHSTIGRLILVHSGARDRLREEITNYLTQIGRLSDRPIQLPDDAGDVSEWFWQTCE